MCIAFIINAHIYFGRNKDRGVKDNLVEKSFESEKWIFNII